MKLGINVKNNQTMCREKNVTLPTTFNFRDIGQPLKNAKKPCTRLNIRSLSNDSTWESTVCFDMQAEYGVCEYPFLSTNASSDSDFAGKYETLNISPDHLDGSVIEA